MTNSGRVERRLAAVLAADVVGYSRLMGADEEGTLAALRSLRRDRVDPKISEYGGRIVRTTGDGLLVEFPSVVQATRCAVDLQNDLREQNCITPEDKRISFRIGINIGDVIVENDDIFGDGVNIAARLEQIAAPGGIAISNRVYEDVRDRLPVEFEDRGEQNLKNITRPVRVWHWGGASTDNRGKGKSPSTADFDQANQKISYCRAPDGVRLAYASVGEGYPLVKAGGFLGHLEYDWKIWGPAWIRFAGTGRRFVRYDVRGNGLSDWEVQNLSHEAWVSDLETVVDAAELDRFALIGFSQGCATAIDYAVRHPDRVSHLILYGGYARGAFRRGNKEIEESVRAQATLMRSGWLSETPAFRQIFSTRMLPDMTPTQAKDFDYLLRHTCTAELAERYQLACGDVDVSHLLNRVKVPTLVLHVRDDAMVPMDGGREMAAGIPGARFVVIPGRNHVPIPGEPTADRSHEEIDRILFQGLERQPTSKRTVSKSSLDQALPLPNKPSIAVLPFQNMSADPEQEYFADGMVEDIITALSRFKSLFVIARNSSFTYKGKSVDIKQVGRELGVHYVLEGSVRKSANKVRITGQLIEAASGTHLWADKFDGSLDDVFELQDNVTASVASTIEGRILHTEAMNSSRKPAENWASYDHYLRGVDLQNKRSRDATLGAIAQFKKAIEIDPMFGLAYARAALNMNFLKYLFQLPFANEDCQEALSLASRAIELSSDDGMVLAYGGQVFGDMGGDFERGASLADHAISLNPNLAVAWGVKAWMYLRLGEAAIAMTAFDQALRLNPADQWLIPSVWRGKANACVALGRHDQGIAWADMLLAQNPSDLPGLWALWANHSLAGNSTEAADAAVRLRSAYPQLRRISLKELLRVRKVEMTSLIDDLISRLNLPD